MQYVAVRVWAVEALVLHQIVEEGARPAEVRGEVGMMTTFWRSLCIVIPALTYSAHGKSSSPQKKLR